MRQKHLASHYDAIIAVHLTSQFSGTFANSLKAGKRISKEFNKPVYTIDSKNLSGALGLLVLKAAKNIEANDSVESIVRSLENDLIQTKIFVSVRDLKYMIKGGRVSKPKGIMARAIGLNPVISMDENGKSILFGKTFSQEASLNKIFDHILKIGRGKTVWNYIILHAHNILPGETANEIFACFVSAFAKGDNIMNPESQNTGILTIYPIMLKARGTFFLPTIFSVLPARV